MRISKRRMPYSSSMAMLRLSTSTSVISVEVTGTVAEFFGETQVAATSVRISGSGTIQPARIDFPRPRVSTNSDGGRIADLEQFEGMLVRIPQAMTVASLRELDRFGEVLLSAGGRPYQFTNGNSPDAIGYDQHRDDVAAARIVLDDGSTEQNPDAIRYLNAGVTPGYSIRVGDEVTDVTGNLRFSRGSGGSGTQGWRLVPTVEPQFSNTNPRPGAPSVGGSLKVASFNALNLLFRHRFRASRIAALRARTIAAARTAARNTIGNWKKSSQLSPRWMPTSSDSSNSRTTQTNRCAQLLTALTRRSVPAATLLSIAARSAMTRLKVGLDLPAGNRGPARQPSPSWTLSVDPPFQ